MRLFRFFCVAISVAFLGIQAASATSILVGAITPPGGGASYGYPITDEGWTAIQFGFSNPVEVRSIGTLLWARGYFSVTQGLITDSLDYSHRTYSTFSIENYSPYTTEMTVVALSSPLYLGSGNYFLVLQGIVGDTMWTGSDGKTFSLSDGASVGSMFSSSSARWDYEPGMGQTFYRSDYPVGMFEINGVPIPEPTSLLFFGTGLVGLAWSRHRRRSRPYDHY
jgi:hypothetical protein